MKRIFAEVPLIFDSIGSSHIVRAEAPPLDLLAEAESAVRTGSGEVEICSWDPGLESAAAYADRICSQHPDHVSLSANVYQWPAAVQIARALRSVDGACPRVQIAGPLPALFAESDHDFED